MVTLDSTMMIDPEFAFVGPMAFDVGKFIGNLLLALFASDGHNADGSRGAQQAWICSSIAEFWTTFSKRCAAGSLLHCRVMPARLTLWWHCAGVLDTTEHLIL